MNILINAFIVFALIFVSCSVEDGETGPAGQDGKNGNANVIASDWIVSELSTSATNLTYFEVEYSNITPDVIDSGAAILAYGKDDSGNIIGLPFVYRKSLIILLI